MRLLPVSLALLGALTGAGFFARPQPGPCPCCRGTNGYLLPDRPAPHVALRFLSQGQLFRPPGPFATYSHLLDAAAPTAFRYQEQVRFGTVYLVKGPALELEGRYHYLQSAVCVRGQDTMQVYVQPLLRQPYWLYDSIPFRPGRYELIDSPVERRIVALTMQNRDSLRITTFSFAAYFQQHQAALARNNPFAGCHFNSPPARRYTTTPDGYIPRQPTDIFNLLLAHSTYLKSRSWQLRQLAPREQVLLKP